MKAQSAGLSGVLSLALIGLASCGPREELDLVGARVLSVEPPGPLVRVEVDFTLRFSEPLNPITVNDDTVVLVPRAQVSDAFLADFKNAPLSESRKAQLVPAEVKLSDDGTKVTLDPTRSLDPRTAYALLVSADVRDRNGNPLVGADGNMASFRYDITTDDGPPALVFHDVTSAGAPLVAPNRKRFTVRFNQPVRNLTAETLRIEPQDGGVTPQVEALILEPERDAATLILAKPASGCERLTPEAAYALRLGPGILDDEGEAMPQEQIDFETGSTCDLVPNQVVGELQVIAGEVSATLRFDTTKASTTEVRYGLEGGALDCLGNPCPARGAPATQPLPGVSPPRFVHSIDISGLEVDVTYAFQVRAEDQVGFVALAEGTLTTAPLPKVAITEFMANAPASVSPDSSGEYIELYNFGDEEVDLSGFAITLDGGAIAGGSTCPIPDVSAPILAPGAYVLVTNSAFQAEPYGLFDLSIVVPMEGSFVCGRGLANDRAQSIGLLDAEGRPVSTYSGYASLKPREGRSIERIAADAPDVEASFCYSRTDLGPTPGAPNGVAAQGCEAE